MKTAVKPQSKKESVKIVSITAQKVYITGINGMLGSSLKKTFLEAGFIVDGCSRSYNNVDITQYEVFENHVLSFNPDYIIHTASLIDINECEKNKKKAELINVGGTENLKDIILTHNLKCKVIHISTPSVFDGQNDGSFDSPLKPVNYYGETKAIQEHLIKELPNWLIIRTNIFGWKKGSFAEWTIDQLLNNPEPTFYDDVFCNLIFVDDLSFLIKKIASPWLNNKLPLHIGSFEKVSKYEFAIELAKVFGYNYSHIKANKIDNSKVNRGNNLYVDVDFGFNLRATLTNFKNARII